MTEMTYAETDERLDDYLDALQASNTKSVRAAIKHACINRGLWE